MLCCAVMHAVLRWPGEGLDEDEVESYAALLPRPLDALPGGGLRHGCLLSVQDQAQHFSVDIRIAHQVRWAHAQGASCMVPDASFHPLLPPCPARISRPDPNARLALSGTVTLIVLSIVYPGCLPAPSGTSAWHAGHAPSKGTCLFATGLVVAAVLLLHPSSHAPWQLQCACMHVRGLRVSVGCACGAGLVRRGVVP